MRFQPTRSTNPDISLLTPGPAFSSAIVQVSTFKCIQCVFMSTVVLPSSGSRLHAVGITNLIKVEVGWCLHSMFGVVNWVFLWHYVLCNTDPFWCRWSPALVLCLSTRHLSVKFTLRYLFKRFLHGKAFPVRWCTSKQESAGMLPSIRKLNRLDRTAVLKFVHIRLSLINIDLQSCWEERVFLPHIIHLHIIHHQSMLLSFYLPPPLLGHKI